MPGASSPYFFNVLCWLALFASVSQLSALTLPPMNAPTLPPGMTLPPDVTLPPKVTIPPAVSSLKPVVQSKLNETELKKKKRQLLRNKSILLNNLFTSIEVRGLIYAGQNRKQGLNFIAQPTKSKQDEFPFNVKLTMPLPTGNTMEYTVLDQVAYFAQLAKSKKNLISSGCQDFAAMPSLSEIMDSMVNAVPVTAKLAGNIKCRFKIYMVSFGGEKYHVCLSTDSKTSTIVYGTDMTIELTPFKATSEAIRAPTALHGTPLECNVSSTSSSSSTDATKAQAESLFNSIGELSSSNCKVCKGGKKKCLFFHGAGVKIDADQLLDQYPLYWGNDILKNAPCCSTIKFARFNTYNISWTDEKLQNKFCKTMVDMDDAIIGDLSETRVDDMIVVTHSMAGLVLGLALDTGKCVLAPSTKWVALSTPLTGSHATEELANMCLKGQKNDIFFTSTMELLGACPVMPAYTNFFWQGSPLSTAKGLDDFYDRAQNGFFANVDAVMCGNNPYGLTSSYSPALVLASSLGKHESPNDGVVEMNSCSFSMDKNQFGTSFINRYYLASINHIDTSFRNGNGFYGDNRKPLRWFSCLY